MPSIVVGRAAHARWDTCPCVALPAAVIIYAEAHYESGPAAALPRRRRAGVSSRRRRAAMRYDEIDHSWRSEEHTSELQSRQYLVCRLLLEKKQHSQSST